MSRNTGEAAGDVYVSIEGLIGSAHADQFYGTAGWDGFYGGGGDDRLEGRGGGDHLDGGDGRDHAVYWSATSGVVASLSAGYGTAGDAAGDVFVSIEGLEGSNHADTLTGDGNGNTLYGYGGNDQLFGLSGNDWIHGGDHSDTLSGGDGMDCLVGGAGRDYFRFDTAIRCRKHGHGRGLHCGRGLDPAQPQRLRRFARRKYARCHGLHHRLRCDDELPSHRLQQDDRRAVLRCRRFRHGGRARPSSP